MTGLITNIYFDVDGVFNADSKKPPRQNTGWTGDWSEQKIAATRVLWSHELVEAVNEISARADVRPVWLTSWEDEAPADLCQAIGLNGENWPVLYGHENDSYEAWWKLDQIREHIALTKPDRVIWVDDHFALDKHAPAWVAAQTSAPVLAISPRSLLGLTRKHVDQIHGFLS